MIAAIALGRPIPKGAEVHHVDGDHANNAPAIWLSARIMPITCYSTGGNASWRCAVAQTVSSVGTAESTVIPKSWFAALIRQKSIIPNARQDWMKKNAWNENSGLKKNAKKRNGIAERTQLPKLQT